MRNLYGLRFLDYGLIFFFLITLFVFVNFPLLIIIFIFVPGTVREPNKFDHSLLLLSLIQSY